MKETDVSADEAEFRTSELNLDEFTGTEPGLSTSMRCWEGEVEVEDRWGIGSPSTRPYSRSPHDAFQNLERFKSRHRTSRRIHRAGRRIFSCFRHSTINLTVPDLEPSTPPRSGPLIAPRTSVSGANGLTFMDVAIDRHHHTEDEQTDAVEPTSPVVNCMGQVKSKKTLKQCRRSEAARERTNLEKLRRTKSQTSDSPPCAAKAKVFKWKHLLRSSSSSISPSNHPPCEGEIDLGRFSSASGTSEPFGTLSAEKRRDKTCLLMQRNCGRTIPTGRDGGDNTLKLLQEQLDAGNSGDVVEVVQQEAAAQRKPVSRKLRNSKAIQIESPKWFADEVQLRRRQGVLNPNPMLDSQTSSTPP
ncbi:uncharacterized protein [Physcomitrium patens]|uniref:Uncharacterized protein n=1 Tax=Physcomitrium patens TaxID=3218 RepID=A0A2K1ID01_PHYPA|nr:uncharacterized protein LOC112278155 [Physcomitrium patens]XP_024367080.1 uncharacterized protein LOC112278155 [Physcomitrium patens]XP_024367081.1 uncharacterized protein LOC112278155 [Physcomitrium patens]XP_024367082.1 uncharacterized protein LOC112278155 [Physcomitrium patens]XP_024367083.1 uncharacterized protein LOC112278155 [Physcomitrium patens]PNR27155.1 hypothetical protein PHYPA_030636 [Physcomitrium patens]|eukprot:XP_024367078.1 uncharacterized protein LOC112278155 [Physcomitrella patens]